MNLILYTAPACHLCDLARELVWPLLEARGGHLEEVDITQSDRLMERYGSRIPVLALIPEASDHPAGDGKRGFRELGWPFEAREIAGLLNARDSSRPRVR